MIKIFNLVCFVCTLPLALAQNIKVCDRPDNSVFKINHPNGPSTYTIQSMDLIGHRRLVDLGLITTVGEIHGQDGEESSNQPWIPEEAGPIEVTMSDGRGVIYVYPTDNSTSMIWSAHATKIGDLTNIQSRGDDINKDYKGAAHTAAIVNQLKTNQDTYAAKLCADLVAYGFDDWYLPAAGELNEIYKKLGANGIGQINTGPYWSSTERNAADAWGQYFDNGLQYAFNKEDSVGCRCVRR